MKDNLVQEFSEFMQTDERLPQKFDQKLRTLMHERIAPPLAKVWPKFVLAQILAALSTLTVCPQFGVGPITGGHGLGHYFMAWGEAGCAAFCGAFFLATGTLVASIILRQGERREIFRYRFRILSAVSMASFLIFMGIGTAFDLPMLYDGFGPFMVWWLAALLSSLAVLHITRLFPAALIKVSSKTVK